MSIKDIPSKQLVNACKYQLNQKTMLKDCFEELIERFEVEISKTPEDALKAKIEAVYLKLITGCCGHSAEALRETFSKAQVIARGLEELKTQDENAP